jgi:hypothetical protein
MHEGSDGSSKFIFDLMEPERPKVKRAVLDFVKGMFSIQPILSFALDGVCRLNPEMARTVVARVSMKNFQSRLVLAASHVGITNSPNRASRRFRSSPPRAGGNVALAAAPLRSRFRLHVGSEMSAAANDTPTPRRARGSSRRSITSVMRRSLHWPNRSRKPAEFLANQRRYKPRTAMTFPGLRSRKDIDDVIAYITGNQ